MRSVGLFLLLLPFILSIHGCVKCSGEDRNEGIIVADAPGTGCNYFLSGNFVIISQEELDSLNVLYQMDCDSSSTIDFNSYSLLINSVSGTCKNKFVRRVERDDAAMKYIYTTTVYSCKCWYKKAEGSIAAVLVPKLPPNYVVEFIVKEE